VAGQSREFRESSSNLYWLFGCPWSSSSWCWRPSRELRAPLTILLTVPLAVFGALASLYVFRQSINIYSQIGLIMLIGLVTKKRHPDRGVRQPAAGTGHGTRGGGDAGGAHAPAPHSHDLVLHGAGHSPIALGLGAGGESRSPLGVSVVGGVIFSTFLTLLVIPVVYNLMGRVVGKVEPVSKAPEPAGVALKSTYRATGRDHGRWRHRYGTTHRPGIRSQTSHGGGPPLKMWFTSVITSAADTAPEQFHVARGHAQRRRQG